MAKRLREDEHGNVSFSKHAKSQIDNPMVVFQTSDLSENELFGALCRQRLQ
jgi:hypothetical protein